MAIHKIKFFAGRGSRYLAEKIVASYGTTLGNSEVQQFSDGEFQPCFNESIRGCTVFIIQSTFPPLDNLMELLMMIDAARRASAYKVIAVMPYFGWARQDRKDRPRVPIGAKLVANMLMAAGVDRVMTMDLHADQIQGFFDVPVDALSASGIFVTYITSLNIEDRSKRAYYIAAMTNAYKTAVNEYMVQRGFEDADGNVLKPFRDRVIRPGDPEYGKPDTEDAIMANADGAFAGKPDIDAVPVGGVPSGNVSAGNVSSGNIAIGEPDNLSYHARSTRRKSNTAAEILPEGWHHAGVRPAPHVTLPDWLLDEPDKVAHRDYSTGVYYPEHKVRQSTDRSAYFRAWLVVGEVLSWSPEDGGRVTIMSRNKIEAGQEVEFVLPGAAPFAYTVPAGGFRDADGHWVEAINNPAHVFSMPCPQEVPVNAAIRSRTKKPTLKAE